MAVEKGDGAATAGKKKPAAAAVPHGEAKNESPFTRPGVAPAPAHVETPSASHNDELRAAIVVWANDAISHRTQWDYTEGPNRLSMYHMAPGQRDRRIEADCSASVSGLYKWGLAPDPNKLGYGGDPYTGTLLEAMEHIDVAKARHADLIVYGPGTGTHVVMILDRIDGHDFWVFSHGEQGDPRRIRHSDLAAWMEQHGHGGVTFLSSLP